MEGKINRVVILGASLGGWVATALSRDLAPDVAVELWDDKTFQEGASWRRLPVVGDQGMRKVHMWKGFIRFAMGGEAPVVVPEKFSKTLAEQKMFKVFPGNEDHEGKWQGVLFVDTTDMPLEDRKELWRAIEGRGGVMMRVSYDGNGYAYVGKGLSFRNAKGGYSMVPNQAQTLMAAGLGAEAVRLMVSGEGFETVLVRVEGEKGRK